VGASGYVLKKSAASELVTAIQEVLKGGVYVTPPVAKAMMRDAFSGRANRASRPASMTPRQREVLQLVAEGHSIKEIASILGLSPKTVEFHKYRIMEVLDIHTTAELTQYAVKHGVVAL